MNQSNKIEIHHRRISNINSLSKALNFDQRHLEFLVQHCGSEMYKENPQIKKDGSIRVCYSVKEPLKICQNKIAQVFFKQKIKFPPYITGSVKGCDFYTNAQIHVGAKFQINDDISSFFPSTSENLVFNVWKYLFKFSDEVANCLTKLTTLNGVLPQGASTSSYIANCVFFAQEPNMVKEFNEKNLIYSRYVDDIVVSSKAHVDGQSIEFIKKHVWNLINSFGYQVKVSKSSITTGAKQSKMQVTGVTNGFDKLKLSREKRKQIEIEVYKFTKTNFINSNEYSCAFKSVSSKISYLARFHPHEAEKLRAVINTNE